MRNKFIIKSSSEESYTIFLNNKIILTASYDEDGWDGMCRIRHVIEKISNILDIPVEMKYANN